MNIKILKSSNIKSKLDGLVVVIDVFRAFSLECYCFENGAKKIIPVLNLEEAHQLKKKYPNYVLLGERYGKKQEGFDYSNSPSDILNVNFTGKTIIHTTSCGTKGLIMAKDAHEILTGSFVNAQATINYIKMKKPKNVYLLCTNTWHKDNEDTYYAKYIKSHLIGKPMDFKKIRKILENHKCSEEFFDESIKHIPREDFDLCLNLDKSDFVIKIEKDNKSSPYLIKIKPPHL